MNRDGVLRMCLQANGILTASISRLNMNVILNDSDIEFFMDKTKKALSDAKLILRRKK